MTTITAPRFPDAPAASVRRLKWARIRAGFRFRDALLVSLIPVAILAYLVGSSLAMYRRARAFDDFYARSVSVESAFRERLHALLALPSVISRRQAFTPDARDPGIINLVVQGAQWDSLVANDVPDWARWYDASLEYGGTAIPVRVRKRGDTSVHWLTEKRSLTVRTPRDQFYKQYRSFGLSSKEVLSSWMANRLALSFGILASHTELSPVFINGRFYGMFRLVEPVDESFLRPFDRMPGNIFRGDRAERGEYFKGQPRNLFDNPYIWDRPAVSDRWTNAGAGQLRLLLDDLAGTRFEDARRMMARFDRDYLARLVAYLLVAGDPYHMDDLHNQLLYEDPSTQQMHPIPWDIRLLPLDGTPHQLNTLLEAWLRDPFVVDAANRRLAEAIRPNAVPHLVDSLVTAAEARYGPYFEYDRRRGHLVGDVGTPREVLDGFRHNVAVLQRWLGSDTVAVAATASGGETVLDLETRGRVGADLRALVLPRPGAVRLWKDANLDGVHDAGDVEIPVMQSGARVELRRPEPLYAGWTTTRGVQAGHVPYRFFVSGAQAGLTVELANRATGQAAASVAWSSNDAIRPATAWHPWRYPEPRGRTQRLAGSVRLTQTLIVPATDTLVIEPGTTLRLAPEVSILSFGRVIARGTPERRITVLPDEAGKPWGTFSYQGSGADSSVMTYADIAGGGGALINRVEYIGMMNVHRARGLVFDHVFFHDNVRSDDTFHALHADVTIRDSHFANANGDAIDFDISSGTLTGNVIENSVNDGMDLMTSTPFIADNLIVGSGDKGISVGEASRPVIFNNRIVRCVRGIEAKDRSEPLILNNDVDSNGVGLRERRKNWRYGGGPWSTVALTTFRRNGISHDPFSRMTLWGTAGVDSTEEAAAPMAGSIAWLYARLGIRPSVPRAGRLAHWERVAPVPPVDAERFTDDFLTMSNGWSPAGGTTRLEKRSDALVMEFERETGSAQRAVAWDLPSGGDVILELAGRDVSAGRVIALADGGAEVDTSFTVSPQPFAFRYVALRLPPGRYRALRIEATPRPGLSHSIQRSTGLSVLRAGRLSLRGFALYAASAGSAAR